MDVTEGKRVKVVNLLADGGGMYFPPESQGSFHARKAGTVGVVISTSWTYAFEKAVVKHDDGSVAVYNHDELGEEDLENPTST